MRLPDKLAVRRALEDVLERSLETMVNAARNTRAGVIHEDSRAEGDKDMRSTEQSYLARGQAMRAEDLAEQLQRLRATVMPSFDSEATIASGALMRVHLDDVPRIFFLLPYGGGVVLLVESVEITVLTPSSPIGQALLGKKIGDEIELTIRGTVRSAVIEELA